jgi:hypothetical protein
VELQLEGYSNFNRYKIKPQYDDFVVRGKTVSFKNIKICMKTTAHIIINRPCTRAKSQTTVPVKMVNDNCLNHMIVATVYLRPQ